MRGDTHRFSIDTSLSKAEALYTTCTFDLRLAWNDGLSSHVVSMEFRYTPEPLELPLSVSSIYDETTESIQVSWSTNPENDDMSVLGYTVMFEVDGVP